MMSLVHNKQSGWATLLVVVMLASITTSLSIYSNRAAIFEQTASKNDYQLKQASNAAEAGMAYGMRYLFNNSTTVIRDLNDDGWIDGVNDPLLTNASLPNDATYSVTFVNPSANNFNLIRVSATGSSADGSATKTVTQDLAFVPFLQIPPPSGVLTKGDVTLGGNITITNTSTDFTIWSGGIITLNGSASTTVSSGTGSTKKLLGVDVIDNDPTLSGLSSDEFFEYFFQTDKDTVKQNAHLYFYNTADTNYSAQVSGQVGKLIFIDQPSGQAIIDGNVTIGSSAQPVILMVSGDLKINGNTTIYGVVYVDQNWINEGGGNLEVNGGVVVNGVFSSTGTPDVLFDQAVLSTVGGNLGAWYKVPGSWRDF